MKCIHSGIVIPAQTEPINIYEFLEALSNDKNRFSLEKDQELKDLLRQALGTNEWLFPLVEGTDLILSSHESFSRSIGTEAAMGELGVDMLSGKGVLTPRQLLWSWYWLLSGHDSKSREEQYLYSVKQIAINKFFVRLRDGSVTSACIFIQSVSGEGVRDLCWPRLGNQSSTFNELTRFFILEN
jgi:hypothetical protein